MASINQSNYESGYHSASGNFALANFEVYSDRHERVARVIDGLQNATGELQYLVVEFLTWDIGKQILIPVHLAQVDLPTQRLYVPSLDRQQVLATPDYNRSPSTAHSTTTATTTEAGIPPMRSLEQSAPLEASAPLEGYRTVSSNVRAEAAIPPFPVTPPTPIPSEAVTRPPQPAIEVPPTRPPADLASEDVISLKEERLVVDRKKQKVGEVIVRKEIETEIIEVPVQREKLIVEQVGADPKQLAEIDLTDESQLPQPQRREVQLPPIPPQER